MINDISKVFSNVQIKMHSKRMPLDNSKFNLPPSAIFHVKNKQEITLSEICGRAHTAEHWLQVIFTENELVSSSLIWNEAYIFVVLMQQLLSYGLPLW